MRLKVQMMKAEVVDTLLHSCVTWSPNKADDGRPRKVHQTLLILYMPRLVETEARRPHPVLRRHACQTRRRGLRATVWRRRIIVACLVSYAWGRSASGGRWRRSRRCSAVRATPVTGEGLGGAPRGRSEGLRHQSSKGGARQRNRSTDLPGRSITEEGATGGNGNDNSIPITKGVERAAVRHESIATATRTTG